ncbi:CD59 glycoprotein-like [Labeo rohita]|uniref:CD59 glycoprotein-like n=1 Tax=Labeo rohita TaxID=84645 RepID=UPI0021E243C3|nr:CD59 glycoprotein-like [Labeo rohita]
MDLQISVFLLFVLSTAGHSLSCYECSGLLGDCTHQTVKTCPSGSSKCLSVTTTLRSVSTKKKFKGCVADCATGSMSHSPAKVSSVCCNNDQCNAQDAPDPSKVPNGKTCYSCDGQSCSNRVSCSGSEDRCFKAKGETLGKKN